MRLSVVQPWIAVLSRAGVACAVLVATLVLHADVVLAPLFSDGAVLQGEKPVPIWGSAAAGEKVTVAFAGQTRTTTADADGRWIVVLDAMPATVAGADLTVTGKQGTVAVHDVVVGEVWLCSGQSNMEFRVATALNAEREIAAANFPLLRHVTIERQVSATPADRVGTSGWKPATPDNVGQFTAVGYFFARDLHQRLGVPIGIVHSSWGGTPVESWMSPMALGSNASFGVVAERWRELVANYPAALAGYEQRLATWTAGEAAAKARGDRALAPWLRQNPKPGRVFGAPNDSWTPTGLFNGMINPLVPYALRGVLWYQGESNTSRPEEYQALFTALITSWRAHFGDDELSFFWVNLANWRPNDPTDTSWARLREAQTRTLALPYTGQAIAIDLGDPVDIHPQNKQEVGRRLALLAKNRVYGIVADDTGPTYLSSAREGAAIRVRFTGAGAGLIAHGKPPQALEIAGADRVFRPAFGRIDRDTLVVWAPEVKEPVAVRYAWRNCPEANLYSGAGLPVVPFRSDDW